MTQLPYHLSSCFRNAWLCSPAIWRPVCATMNATRLPSVVLFLQHWMLLACHLSSYFCNTECYSPAICRPVSATLNATRLPSIVLFLQHWMLLACHLSSFPFPSGQPALWTWRSADRRAVERLWNMLTCCEKNFWECKFFGTIKSLQSYRNI